jgi:hypothetical protein
MPAPDQRSSLWLAASLAAVLAVALGMGLGWWLRGAAPQVPSFAPAPERSVASDATREEIEALKRELLARLDGLARERTTQAATTSDDQVIELGRRVEELDARIALLDKRPARPDGSPLWKPPRGPGCSSIEAIVERLQAWYHPSHTDRRGDDIETQLKREHDLWTFDDVVRTYGAPRRWERYDQGWNLFYGSFDVEGWDLKQSVSFCLRDGYLSQVEIADSQP